MIRSGSGTVGLTIRGSHTGVNLSDEGTADGGQLLELRKK